MLGSPGMFGISGMLGILGMFGISGMFGRLGMMGIPGMLGSHGMLGNPGSNLGGDRGALESDTEEVAEPILESLRRPETLPWLATSSDGLGHGIFRKPTVEIGRETKHSRATKSVEVKMKLLMISAKIID